MKILRPIRRTAPDKSICLLKGVSRPNNRTEEWRRTPRQYKPLAWMIWVAVLASRAARLVVKKRVASFYAKNVAHTLHFTPVPPFSAAMLLAKIISPPNEAELRERLFAVHGLSERTTVQTSSFHLRLFFFYLLANPTQPDPYR